MKRAEVLEKAQECVCVSREADYGKAEDNFKSIARYWEDYITSKGYRVELGPCDVAVMMMLLKIARISNGRAKGDNWVDIAGYAACGGEIESGEKGVMFESI